MSKVKMALLFSIIVWCTGITFSKEAKNIKIGITQIVEHKALDLSKQGFLKALKDNGFGDADIEARNAQGDFATAQLIAQSFVNQKKDLIFTISTPSSQAALNATKEIPIVITAVTDPTIAGLISKNLTGTSDPMPIDEQVNLIKQVLPNVKTVGLIYNTSEQNSAISIERTKKELEKVGLKFEEAGVTSINDISPALSNLLNKVDLIFLTTDNLISSAAPLVIEMSNKANKPVLAGEESHIPFGALMTRTIDFEKIGYRAGEMAVEILKGKAPSEIPIEPPKENRTIVNKKIAEKYNIDMSIEILKNAEIAD
ncbi:MAG: ABC transporter substrate-binding protein [Fusobacteriaceae bacterium]|jgi:putative ABC transport system substrate-binding protein|nr:ABC transporter substrate-binding protein [Fusobacteriaceae bacterium]